MPHGVLYEEIPLLNDTDIDFQKLEQSIDETVTMVLIQRSKGYSTRKSLSIETLKKSAKLLNQKIRIVFCFVDNCYGEFVDAKDL